MVFVIGCTKPFFWKVLMKFSVNSRRFFLLLFLQRQTTLYRFKGQILVGASARDGCEVRRWSRQYPTVWMFPARESLCLIIKVKIKIYNSCGLPVTVCLANHKAFKVWRSDKRWRCWMQFPLLLLCWNALIPVRLTHNISSGKLKHALKSHIATGNQSSLAPARDVDVTGQRRGILKGASPACLRLLPCLCIILLFKSLCAVCVVPDTRACFIAEPCSAMAAVFEWPGPRGQHKDGWNKSPSFRRRQERALIPATDVCYVFSKRFGWQTKGCEPPAQLGFGFFAKSVWAVGKKEVF